MSMRAYAYDRCDAALDAGQNPKWSPNNDYLEYWLGVYRDETSNLRDALFQP